MPIPNWSTYQLSEGWPRPLLVAICSKAGATVSVARNPGTTSIEPLTTNAASNTSQVWTLKQMPSPSSQ